MGRNWIAIDVDGVLADHVSHVLPVLKQYYGLEVSVSQIKTWDFPIGDTTFGSILRTAQKLPEFVMTTPVVPGACESMSKLSESYNLAVVTARPPESADATRHWLLANNIVFDDFVNLSEGTKHATEIPCSILVDDYPVNVLEFLRRSKGNAILFSQPWNQNYSELQPYITSGRLERAVDWNGVLELVGKRFEA